MDPNQHPGRRLVRRQIVEEEYVVGDDFGLDGIETDDDEHCVEIEETFGDCDED